MNNFEGRRPKPRFGSGALKPKATLSTGGVRGHYQVPAAHRRGSANMIGRAVLGAITHVSFLIEDKGGPSDLEAISKLSGVGRYEPQGKPTPTPVPVKRGARFISLMMSGARRVFATAMTARTPGEGAGTLAPRASLSADKGKYTIEDTGSPAELVSIANLSGQGKFVK